MADPIHIRASLEQLFIYVSSFHKQKQGKNSQGWPGHFSLQESIVTIQGLTYLTFEHLSPEFNGFCSP